MRYMNYRKIFCCIVVPVIILICCVSFCINTNAETTGDRVDDVVSYESVLICKGDTLWSIAKANLQDPTDAEIQEYVDEIASINNISPTHIHTGNYILLPKYESF